MKSLLCVCIILVVVQVFGITAARGQGASPFVQVGRDGSIKGGFNTAKVINQAAPGLAFSDSVAANVNFQKRPGQALQTSNAHTNNLNLAEQPKSPFTYERNPDGSVSGSFGISHAVNGPGTNGAFGASQTFSFGPNGASFGGSQSASLNGGFPGGNNFGFNQANSNSQNYGPNGFGSAGSNSASSQFSNPQFSSSQANANAFANQVNYKPQQPFQQQQPNPFYGPSGQQRPFNPYRRFGMQP